MRPKPALVMLKASVKQRLDEVAEEIFGLFERTVADYEEKLSKLKEQNQQHKLLSAVFSPEVQLHRSGLYVFSVIVEHHMIFR